MSTGCSGPVGWIRIPEALRVNGKPPLSHQSKQRSLCVGLQVELSKSQQKIRVEVWSDADSVCDVWSRMRPSASKPLTSEKYFEVSARRAPVIFLQVSVLPQLAFSVFRVWQAPSNDSSKTRADTVETSLVASLAPRRPEDNFLAQSFEPQDKLIGQARGPGDRRRDGSVHNGSFSRFSF